MKKDTNFNIINVVKVLFAILYIIMILILSSTFISWVLMFFITIILVIFVYKLDKININLRILFFSFFVSFFGSNMYFCPITEIDELTATIWLFFIIFTPLFTSLLLINKVYNNRFSLFKSISVIIYTILCFNVNLILVSIIISFFPRNYTSLVFEGNIITNLILIFLLGNIFTLLYSVFLSGGVIYLKLKKNK